MIDVAEDGRFVVSEEVRDEAWLRETLIRESKPTRDPKTGFTRLQVKIRMHRQARFGAVRKLINLLVAKDVRVWRTTLARLPEGEGGKQEGKPKLGRPEPVERPAVQPPSAKKANDKGFDLLDELWIRIRVLEGSPPDRPALHIIMDQRVMADLADAEETLRRISQVPGLKKACVILDVEADALCEWVLRVLETLRELGFENMNFKQ